MQPIKLKISGKYWDSQLYSGVLYLFRLDNSVLTIDWEKLLDQLNINEDLKLAVTCAFSRSDYLYGYNFKLLFEDFEVKEVIKGKFERLSLEELELSEEKIQKCKISEQNNPFPFPHSDTEIYMNNLYASSKQGVFRATCNRKQEKYFISTRAEKKWDAPVSSISGSYSSLALAAGNDGLFELPISRFKLPRNIDTPKNLSRSNCIECGWTFYSIYASSHTDDSYHATFEKRNERYERIEYQREFKEILFSQDIFAESGYSWGTQDKIYKVDGNIIYIMKYLPWNKENGVYKNLGSIQLQQWKGGVISGKNVLFGVIIECENAIVVKLSDESYHNIPGEPVNWRVFPRSKFYENQLHIVYSNYLEIYSFNHDYFINQKLKKIGSEHFEHISPKRFSSFRKS